MNFLVIIQARLGSTRFPNKVLETVNGVPMVKRVYDAAKASWADKVIVAWPERYPDLDENDVRERFRRISNEFPSKYIIRLTSDCPLITTRDINSAIQAFNVSRVSYFNNHKDGFDVQICLRNYLHDDYFTDKEHVFKGPLTASTGLSVNTKEDLERVREYARKMR